MRLPIGRAQQIAVTLNGVFTFQHETTIGPEVMNSTRPSKNGFPRVQHKSHEPVQRSGAAFWCRNFEPCSFKARKDITYDVFCSAFGLMMEKVRSIAIFTSVNVLLLSVPAYEMARIIMSNRALTIDEGNIFLK